MAELERGAVICAGCGLLCDDVILERSGDGVRLQPRCDLGADWFSRRVRPRTSEPAATIGGQPADVDAALTRAGELLRGARRPLVYGFDAATVEDARAALALADRLGALVTTGHLDGDWPGVPAIPLRGASTATLGEIRDRSRVVVIWREDPESTHPRLLDRLGADHTLVVLDDRETPTAQRADLRLGWPIERDLEALTALHVLQRGLPVYANGLQDDLGGLLERINAVPHAAFVHGPRLTSGSGGQRRALALHELVRELCLGRHVVTLALPAAAGTRAADDVLTWQTGYPASIDLASGHPELITRPPGEDEGVDVSLSIQGAYGDALEGITTIALSSLPVAGVDVSIRTASAGVDAGGTAHRLDGVPMTLPAALPGDAPTAAVLLTRLLEEVER